MPSKPLLTDLRGVGPRQRRQARRAPLAADEDVTRTERLLVFSQFADTVDYLEAQLKNRGSCGLWRASSGSSADPTAVGMAIQPGQQPAAGPGQTGVGSFASLIATDILSEGQNLQDCHIVVNYDLPWAIIRLIQRAGRVDRIGQKAEENTLSLLPASRGR